MGGGAERDEIRYMVHVIPPGFNKIRPVKSIIANIQEFKVYHLYHCYEQNPALQGCCVYYTNAVKCNNLSKF